MTDKQGYECKLSNKPQVLFGRSLVILGVLILISTGLVLSGCAKKETPAPEPVAEVPIKEPEPIEVEPTIPAEPYITKETLDGLTTEGSKYFAPVQNDHEAKAKGRNQYVIQDPNTENVKLYTIDLPTDVGIVSVKKYEPAFEGDWGQIEATGIVIDMGAVDIKEGEVDANTPNTKAYIFDKKDATPAEFAASIESPEFGIQVYTNTPTDRFNDFWVEATEGNDLFTNATWGIRDNGPGGPHRGEKVGDFTAIENDNRQIDSLQFPADYESECYFGGQVFHQMPADKISMFTEFTFVSGGTLQGKIPNLNDPSVRELLSEFAVNANLQSAKATVDGEYATID